MADEDDDALLDELERETENDPTLAHLREARIQQLVFRPSESEEPSERRLRELILISKMRRSC